jgi:hypothetical protein
LRISAEIAFTLSTQADGLPSLLVAQSIIAGILV